MDRLKVRYGSESDRRLRAQTLTFRPRTRKRDP
jgi:hypothetical protein